MMDNTHTLKESNARKENLLDNTLAYAKVI